MRDRDIGDILGMEGDRLQGIVTDRDIVVRCVADGGDISTKTLADVCSPELITVTPDTKIEDAANLEQSYKQMRETLDDSARLVRYQGRSSTDFTALVDEFSDFGLEILGPTAEHLAILRSLGCEYGQGYYFAKPLAPEEVGSLLASARRW